MRHTLAFIWLLLFCVLLCHYWVQHKWNFSVWKQLQHQGSCRCSSPGGAEHWVFKPREVASFPSSVTFSSCLSGTRKRHACQEEPPVCLVPARQPLRKHAAQIDLRSEHRSSVYSTPALLLALQSNSNVNGTRGTCRDANLFVWLRHITRRFSK